MITVGKKAPEFAVPAYYKGDFVEYSLSDFAGKWVLLLFYPGDITFVWPTELAAVAAQQKQLVEMDVQILVCSVDSKFVHKSWEDHELKKLMPDGVPYPMLADCGGKIGRMFGVFDEDSNINFRGRFIIDPDGVVQSAEILTPPVGRNIPEMIRQIRGFRKVRETGGNEVCPAGWHEGKPTLKPSPELVGKVADVMTK